MTEAALEKIDVESMELIVGDQVDVQVVFQGPGMGSLIDSIERIVDTFVPDATTDGGRKDIISLAYKVSQSKTFLEKKGAALTEAWRTKTKTVNANIKIAKTRLDTLRDKTRQPVADWEAEEEKKKAAEAEAFKLVIDDRIKQMAALNRHPIYSEISTMDEIEFDNALFSAKEDFDEAERVKVEEEEAKKAAEDARKAEVQEEADRQVIITASQDKKDEEQRNAQKVLDAARDKLAADRKALDDEKKRIADAEAEKQAEEDAKGKAVERGFSIPHVSVGGNHEPTERDLKAKEREEEMKPDREKLERFFTNVQIAVTGIQCAPLATTEATRLLSLSFDSIRATIDDMKERTEEL